MTALHLSLAFATGALLGVGAMAVRYEQREPAPVPSAAPVVVLVVAIDRDAKPDHITLDFSDELLSYPPADDEPPQRPWQYLRAEGRR